MRFPIDGWLNINTLCLNENRYLSVVIKRFIIKHTISPNVLIFYRQLDLKKYPFSKVDLES